MTIPELLLLLFIAGLCGSVAQSLAGGPKSGCLASIALGFIGALLGTYLARAAGLPEMFAIAIGGKSFPIIWSIIGAALFAAVLAMFSKSRRR